VNEKKTIAGVALPTGTWLVWSLCAGFAAFCWEMVRSQVHPGRSVLGGPVTTNTLDKAAGHPILLGVMLLLVTYVALKGKLQPWKLLFMAAFAGDLLGRLVRGIVGY
jgi:hypothetical protein